MSSLIPRLPRIQEGSLFSVAVEGGIPKAKAPCSACDLRENTSSRISRHPPVVGSRRRDDPPRRACGRSCDTRRASQREPLGCARSLRVSRQHSFDSNGDGARQRAAHTPSHRHPIDLPRVYWTSDGLSGQGSLIGSPVSVAFSTSIDSRRARTYDGEP